MFLGPAPGVGRWEQGLDQGPLVIGQVRGVGRASWHGDHARGLTAQRERSTRTVTPSQTRSEPDGRPQLSVVWAQHTESDVLFATVKGRRKYENILRNPLVTVLIMPRDSQDHYVEIRGHAQIEDGGRELIDRLHQRHRDTRPYPWDSPDDERVVVRVVPDRVLVFHG
ncbi:TIGR03618 family F420-dependent PPOX class oxidoreductase [Nocardiopsis kunsanensis]|uniref:TIGR03618 family F420-dependent PPOX class oxidoreductase n=1 Tax=Nocardiopsis kunsanensis TaxID=141693 RepID=UPI000A071EF5|nr:TIGR03618 family F420-dependent PPOX class oxidoreductase [Nocardiopsis kunsanensis]